MLNNLETLKKRFDDKTYAEMTNTLKECSLFFRSFKREPIRLEKIRKNLDSNIATADNLLIKLIKPN